jgi:surface protein
MPTLNYSFEELWGERGEGTSSISLTAGTTYNFLITSSIGAGYLTLETVRNYDGVTPKNTSGSYTALTNIASSVISDYIAGFSVPQGFSSFVYTPASNVVGSTLKLRGVGGVILGSGSNTPTPPPPTSATFQVDTTQTTVGSTANNVFKLPLTNNGVINFTIDWGDGNTDVITSYNQAETTHTYATPGVYEVAITSGVLRGWQFAGSGDRNKLIEIYDWSKWDFNVDAAFRGCNNLISSATNTPTITSTTLNSMFSRANIFNGPIGGWDISGVTDLTLMFFSANVFNQDISSWDVSNVTQFNGMFSSASAFNQNIGGWNVSSSTNMDSMFGQALAFDQNIGSWNVRNVTDFAGFMNGKSPSNFSTTNLNAIYNGWSALPSLQSNVTASFGNINYTAAGAAGGNTLVTTYNWLITDGGQV